MVDNNRLVGELVVCQASTAVADCGDPKEGCPDCESITMEVNCPCCTSCCYDADETCNMGDWLSQILTNERKDNPVIFYPSDSYQPSDYTPKDTFVPKQEAASP